MSVFFLLLGGYTPPHATHAPVSDAVCVVFCLPKRGDPVSAYCLIEVDDEEVARTSTIWHTFNPFFGESFNVAMPHNFSVMTVTVVDQVCFHQQLRTVLPHHLKHLTSFPFLAYDIHMPDTPLHDRTKEPGSASSTCSAPIFLRPWTTIVSVQLKAREGGGRER